MASLDDMLTTAKNIVTAINGLNQTFAISLGNQTSSLISADKLLVSGRGRLVSFWVTVAGSGDGAIYNSISVTAPVASTQLVNIPQTLGYHVAGVNFTSGLVITVGAGQALTVTYYLV